MSEDNKKSVDYRHAALDDLDKRLDEFLSELEGVRDRTAKQLSERSEPRKVRKQNVHGGHRERMRSSAKRDKNLDGFSDVELLELLLSFTVPQKDTNVLAHTLLDKFGSVAAVIDAPESELAGIPNLTKNAIAVFGMLAATGPWSGWLDIKIKSPVDVADFFGAMFLSGADNGTFIAYLDETFAVISVEFSPEPVPMRMILGSVAKYSARNVIAVRRETAVFPDSFGLAEQVRQLLSALDFMGTRLLDFMLFTDYGYYTVCTEQKRAGEWYPQYVFVPESVYSRAPKLLEKIRGDN